jgi:hypothetical protein
MANPPQLREFVQATIRAEKARRNLTFAELSEALRAHGVEQSATNLSTKVGRGGMSAQLFLAIMKVLGRNAVDLSVLDLPERKPPAARGARKRREA